MRDNSPIRHIYRQPIEPRADGFAPQAASQAASPAAAQSASAASPGNASSSSPQNGEGQQSKGSAASRSLDIIEAVAMAERPLTPAELCAKLGLPKATVHRLCAALEQRGLLEASINGRGLLPGRGLYRLATGVFASTPFQAERHVILQALSTELGETCNISVPGDTHMLYIDRAETHWPVRVQLPVGSRVPFFCTASGRMYLSSLSTGQQRRILTHLPIEKLTNNTLTDIDELLSELTLTAERGFSLDNEEYMQGMVALAVPVTDASGQLYATLSCHAPCMRVTLTELQSNLSALQSAASELEKIGKT